MKKKLYFVKREVMASSLKGAMTARGSIYEILLARESDQPVEEKPTKGFKPKK